MQFGRKKHVIPVGHQDNPQDKLYPELGMEWSSNFTILGFEIDNKLQNLNKNYSRVFDKIKGIIKSWTPTNYH